MNTQSREITEGIDMSFTKITNADLKSRGATTLPNQPAISAQALKEEFDAPAKEIVAPKFNNLIDELEAAAGAASLGAVAPTGYTGETVQALLNALALSVRTIEAVAVGATPPTGLEGENVQQLINELNTSITNINESITDLNAKKHTHLNKALLDTYEQTEANLADAVSKKHSHSNKSTLDKLSEDGDGNPTFNGNTIPTTGQTGGLQKFIDSDSASHTSWPSGTSGELKYELQSDGSRHLYRYENNAWTRVYEINVHEEGSPATNYPLTNIVITSNDIGEGVSLDPGTIVIVVE